VGCDALYSGRKLPVFLRNLVPTSTRIKEMVTFFQAVWHDIPEHSNITFCLFVEDTYVDYMKSDLLSVDEEPLQSVDVSPGFSFGSGSEGTWLLGDSNVSCPCFSMEYERLTSKHLSSKIGIVDFRGCGSGQIQISDRTLIILRFSFVFLVSPGRFQDSISN
jgi:hypothetical protein